MQTTALSLSQFPIVDTHDSEVMREIMMTRYGAAHFESSKSNHFLGRSAVAGLGSASLIMCAYATRSLADFSEAGFVRLQIAFAGTARTTIAGRAFEVGADQSCVTPAGRPCRIEFGAGYQQILIRVEQGAMEQRIAALLGAKPRGRLEFSASTLGKGHVHLDGLKNLIRFVAGELATPRVQMPHFLSREFEDTLLVAFLKAIPNSFSDFLHRRPSIDTAAHVRRVEEYIDAHWQLPISVEKLADVSGVGARTIFATFKRHRGYTPLGYVKMVRLKNANNLLQAPTETTSVTNVALSCGFSNLGHFANDYQDTFGELPSLTLARARRLQ
ncbi:AraC family transcriptional regulator [Mesorhizobium sp. NZP2077]|uniref:AraC family transcriptional regulator n=1 Tax=Mesorhizobium sp. NZP2077 TaxID=2483404 RepID=UPI0015539AC7|nr:AraC family transcriptional regulator [Mesorhizobium sp. NZP2077]QKC82910.1 AraC family transcriptional regulator [Mesorhizobium sp. NZP2077]QKD16409.1 AraC family transcriptional regulator [Mesorhizobium sp. NZP2077]